MTHAALHTYPVVDLQHNDHHKIIPGVHVFIAAIIYEESPWGLGVTETHEIQHEHQREPQDRHQETNLVYGVGHTNTRHFKTVYTGFTVHRCNLNTRDVYTCARLVLFIITFPGPGSEGRRVY